MRSSSNSWAKPLPLVLVVAAMVAALIYFDAPPALRGALVWVEQLGPAGAVIFVLLYIVAAVFLVPGSVLTLAAGTLFGVVYGSVLVSLASTLGAAAAFLIGRYAARDWVAAKVAGNATFQSISQTVSREGWKLVGLTRLSPVFPYTLLNYAYGLTPVKFVHYILASWIAMMPATVMFVYLGSIARAGATSAGRTPAQWGLYGLGLLATIGVTIFVTRIAKKALAVRTAAPPP